MEQLKQLNELHGALSNVIKYSFNDIKLLGEALTHPGTHIRMNNTMVNYQRLEFLGDGVLNMVISEMLFNMFPNDHKNELIQKRNILVSGKVLSTVAGRLGLCNYIFMDHGNEECSDVVREDAMEALVGAVYLDGGFDTARDFVSYHWKDFTTDVGTIIDGKLNPKSELQEWSQMNKLPIPTYDVVGETGNPPNQEFTVKVTIPDVGCAEGRGSNVKIASTKAAEIMMQKISNNVSADR